MFQRGEFTVCAAACLFSIAAARGDGRRTMNSLPLPGLRFGVDRAAVQFDQPAHQRQADAQAALGPFQRPVRLAEHVEYVGQRFARDADSVVANHDDGLRPVQPGFDLDPAPSSVNFALLFNRLEKTWPSASDRRSRKSARSGSVTGQLVTGRVNQRPARFRPRLRTTAPIRSRSLRSSILSREMRLTSRRSSTSRVICCTCRSMTCAASSRQSIVAAVASAASSNPLRIGASGLRSSCASVARNWSLRRSASEQRLFGRCCCVMSRVKQRACTRIHRLRNSVRS